MINKAKFASITDDFCKETAVSNIVKKFSFHKTNY